MEFKDLNKLKKQLEKDVQEAHAAAASEFEQEADKAISTVGYFPNFPNSDIIDSERLRKSLVIDSKENKTTFTWDPIDPETGFHYGPSVWFGYHAFGKKYIPGRPWDLEALKAKPQHKIIAEKLKEKGYQVKPK